MFVIYFNKNSLNVQATLHGVCGTNFAVNSKEDIATDVTITRDLSKCDSFIAQRDHTSPLAIISGMVRGRGNVQKENFMAIIYKKTFGHSSIKHCILIEYHIINSATGQFSS